MKLTNIGVKTALLGLFAHYLLYPDLLQYQNKGMAARLIIYPLIVFSIFIVYSIFRRRTSKNIVYPHLSDLLVSLAFTIDVLGNTLNLFNRIEWWDDLMHLVLWLFWVLAIGTLLRIYTSYSRFVVASLTAGLGAITNIIWELAEYITFVPNNPLEGPSAYRDSMGDMALSLVGSILGALIIYTVLWNTAKNKN